MKIRGEDRRNKIIEILNKSTSPVSGTELAQAFEVSRQVIVTDIALLRAQGSNLISTPTGYILMKTLSNRRIFKVRHTDEETENELNTIIDLGGIVIDVYIEHKVYGTISAPLNISSKRDIQNFLNDIKSGVSSPLKNITHGYHYHTIEARSREILDEIESSLKEKGFLIDTLEDKSVYSAKNYSKI